MAAIVVLAFPWRRLTAIQGPPRLWADGAHDDTEALQWYIEHAKEIPSARYRMSKTLHVYPDRGHCLIARQSRFEWPGDFGGPGIHVHGDPANWHRATGNAFVFPEIEIKT